MFKRIAIVLIFLLSTLFSVAPASAATHRKSASQARHKRHMRTAKRVGVGAAGGAAIGALAGHGKGAAVGAAAGAGAGALYDHEKNKKR